MSVFEVFTIFIQPEIVWLFVLLFLYSCGVGCLFVWYAENSDPYTTFFKYDENGRIIRTNWYPLEDWRSK